MITKAGTYKNQNACATFVSLVATLTLAFAITLPLPSRALAACGDGIIDSGEQCDDGNSVNTDACPDGPAGTCKTAVCGDGFVRTGVEQCDDGNKANTDVCLNNCTLNVCGDGFMNVGVEQCDDGDSDDSDFCLSDCTEATCGDGIACTNADCSLSSKLNDPEACDDGNSFQSDDCKNNCTLNVCGDGFVRAGVEQCDDGDALCVGGPNDGVLCGSDPGLCVGGSCPTAANRDDLANHCRTVCTVPSCGDGVVDNAKKVCIGGDNLGARCGADADCTNATSGVCPDCCKTTVEDCDEGALNSDNGSCTSSCKNASCGDGLVCSSLGCTKGPGAGPEQCDVRQCEDGTPCVVDSDDCAGIGSGTCILLNSNAPNAPCRPNCSQTRCGDNVVDDALGEECDDGNSSNTDACPDGQGGTCKDAICGDGFVRTGVETCDDGNGENTDACPDGQGGTCKTAICGDGFVRTGVEDCDDANASVTDDCTPACKTNVCGDGFPCLDASCTSGPGGGPEECDLGVGTCTASGGINSGGDCLADTDCPGTCKSDAPSNQGAPCTTADALVICGDASKCDSAGTCEGGNRIDTADTCRTDCGLPACGDGTVDGGATCFDGDLDKIGKTCSSNNDCVASGSCANCCQANLEACDPAGDPNGLCNAGCQSATCGDGAVCSDNACDTKSIGPEECDVAVCEDGSLCVTDKKKCDNDERPCKADGDCVGGGTCVNTDCQGIGDGSCTVLNANNPDAECRADCTAQRCGDGVVDVAAGEECDNGDGTCSDGSLCTQNSDCNQCNFVTTKCKGDPNTSCSKDADCAAAATCTGNSNEPDACRTDCTLPVCGDAVIDTYAACLAGDNRGERCTVDSDCTNDTSACAGCCATFEQCDNGAANSDDANCTVECKDARCGDGPDFLCSAATCTTGPKQCDDGKPCTTNTNCTGIGSGRCTAGPEACDDGNTTNNDGCGSDCHVETCGNGIIESEETCDDGNTVTGDGCDASCRKESCGDAIQTLDEQCDLGSGNSNAANAACRTDCTLQRCGDGAADTDFGEGCDVSRCSNGTTACVTDADCTGIGDGKCRSQNSTDPNAPCRPDCTLRRCGDGTIDPASGEVCDDGNESNNDTCPDDPNALVPGTCKVPTCGDGFRCADAACTTGPVTCDDGSTCTVDTDCTGIGDGLCKTHPEECDKGTAGNTGAPDICRSDCRLPRCGDGVVDPARGEQCDETSTDCSSLCCNANPASATTCFADTGCAFDQLSDHPGILTCQREGKRLFRTIQQTERTVKKAKAAFSDDLRPDKARKLFRRAGKKIRRLGKVAARSCIQPRAKNPAPGIINLVANIETDLVSLMSDCKKAMTVGL